MMTKYGHIEVIIGPMFAGKTTELFRRLNRYKIAKKKVVIIKPKIDIRYSIDCAATHDQIQQPAISCDHLSEAINYIQDSDVIGIDEGQFYDDLIEYCEKWANEGKIVILAALNGTYRREPFGQVNNLISKAEKVDTLTAVCSCSSDASFTKKILGGDEIKDVGGSEKYISVCRNCF